MRASVCVELKTQNDLTVYCLFSLVLPQRPFSQSCLCRTNTGVISNGTIMDYGAGSRLQQSSAHFGKSNLLTFVPPVLNLGGNRHRVKERDEKVLPFKGNTGKDSTV